jgi:cbb3-type cytochrome c oxidase subunit III
MRVLAGSRATLVLLVVGVAHLCNTPGAAVPFIQEGKTGAAATDAKRLFARHCATCHGRDGQAETFKAKFNRARNLTDPAWQAEVSDERLFNSITHGRGHMPAWGKKLSEAEIDALVAYVRRLKK